VAWAATCSPMEDAVLDVLRVSAEPEHGGSIVTIGRPRALYRRRVLA
jgi:hypothetical protein